MHVCATTLFIICFRNMNNSTSPDLELSGQPQFTCYTLWGVVIATNNRLSFAVNCLSIPILTDLKSSANRPYRQVLIRITLCDIFTLLTTAVFYSCLPFFASCPKNEYNLSCVVKVTVGLGSVFFPMFVCYWIFVFVSIQQSLGFHASNWDANTGLMGL